MKRARLLSLPNPDRQGARAIREAWNDLEQLGFVSKTPGRDPSGLPTYALNRENGDGRAYTLPRGAGDPYFRVPEKLWDSSLLVHSKNKERDEPDGLSSSGLVMYLILLQIAGAARRLDGLVVPEAPFQAKYGLGVGLRKDGLRNLYALGLLDRDFEPVDDDGDIGGRRRKRYVYSFSGDSGFGPPALSKKPSLNADQKTPV